MTTAIKSTFLKSLAAAFACAALLTGLSAFADEQVRQWVGAVGDGVVEGRMLVPASVGDAVAVEDVVVSLRSRRGVVVKAEARTDESGQFQFSNVQPGVYTITCQGKSCFAHGVLHVLTEDVATNGLSIDIPAAELDRATIDTAMLRYLATATDTEDLRDDLPPESLTSNGTPIQVLSAEGGMKGRFLRDPWEGAPMTNVFIFKAGKEIKRTITDEDGRFRIENLEPGIYAIIGAGRYGFYASGFELVDPLSLNTVQVKSDARRKFVSLIPTPVPDEFTAELGPYPPGFPRFGPTTGGDIAGSTTMPPGYGGGPSGGGGGFSGGGGTAVGGGDLGGIAGLAGIGAIIAITASDDDGTIVASPPSPIVP